jgi:hypothetical protein
MEIKVEEKEWGTMYEMKEKDYNFALYFFNDDYKTIYFSNVKVCSSVGKRLDDEILSSAEKWSKQLLHSAKIIMLKCLNESCVVRWHERHGYKFYANDEDDPRYVWLMKYLSK